MTGLTLPRQPELIAAPGSISLLPDLLARRGHRAVAIVTGGRSIRGKEQWSHLTETLLDTGIDFLDFTVRGEPSPQMVDHFHHELSRDLVGCDGVIAIGGGSVIDAGKALAAAVAMGRSGEYRGIQEYLEGVGTQEASGETLPLFALPTTAGTGSEATKNAVLSSVGPGGFKKSLRHDNFIPAVAMIDPDLQVGTPPEVTAASGLDAITQLIEVYLSTKANPVSDALALTGLRAAGTSFPRILSGEDTPELRLEMALAAYLSGVGLAAVGLGVVHGIASPLGALREIPHGVVCAKLLAPSISHTLADAAPETVVRRYAAVADALEIPHEGGEVPAARVAALIARIEQWAAPLPAFSTFGCTRDDAMRVARETGVKEHPVTLAFETIVSLIGDAL